MANQTLPCGCILEWNERGVSMSFCMAHGFDYASWDGDDEEFIKMVATPDSRMIDYSTLSEMK